MLYMIRKPIPQYWLNEVPLCIMEFVSKIQFLVTSEIHIYIKKSTTFEDTVFGLDD